MIIETTYFDSDLRAGTCKSCDEDTMIVPGDGRCPDCIEEWKFYKMTMKGPMDNEVVEDDEF